METIEQEIWNDFEMLSEGDRKKKAECRELVSLGINKRLENDEDYRINKFLASVGDVNDIDWSILGKLYPIREPVKLPKSIHTYPPAKFRSRKDRLTISSFIDTDWQNRKSRLVMLFPNEQAAKEYLVSKRGLGHELACPHCNTPKPYVTNRGYKCRNSECYKKFSEKIGTIFANTNQSLLKWYEAIYLLTSTKTRKISSYQLSQCLLVSQKTAWYMAQKIQTKVDDQFMRNISHGLFA